VDVDVVVDVEAIKVIKRMVVLIATKDQALKAIGGRSVSTYYSVFSRNL
jgi:hypothetical protein